MLFIVYDGLLDLVLVLRVGFLGVGLGFVAVACVVWRIALGAVNSVGLIFLIYFSVVSAMGAWAGLRLCYLFV